MSIAQLAPEAASQLCATSAITDACSVVKELVDNALDARAHSISIEVAANTLDTFMVKDDGTGIAVEGRDQVCRPNCTSKLHGSTPTGQVSARSLGVTGASRVGGGWVFAPSSSPTLTDAATKVLGRHAMAQSLSCSWPLTPPNADDDAPSPKLIALLPKVDADTTQVTAGAYLTVDGRPLAPDRGLARTIGKSVKRYLGSARKRRGLPEPAGRLLWCLQITGPPGEYDVNCEPAKDDAVFSEESSGSIEEEQAEQCCGDELLFEEDFASEMMTLQTPAYTPEKRQQASINDFFGPRAPPSPTAWGRHDEYAASSKGDDLSRSNSNQDMSIWGMSLYETASDIAAAFDAFACPSGDMGLGEERGRHVFTGEHSARLARLLEARGLTSISESLLRQMAREALADW
ncbi:hypothetical protein KEM52_000576 [Ascosphaera acerosa]|nr:hypothetical protein KEM52_000576 [Ascosphaera acerosa]